MSGFVAVSVFQVEYGLQIPLQITNYIILLPTSTSFLFKLLLLPTLLFIGLRWKLNFFWLENWMIFCARSPLSLAEKGFSFRWRQSWRGFTSIRVKYATKLLLLKVLSLHLINRYFPIDRYAARFACGICSAVSCLITRFRSHPNTNSPLLRLSPLWSASHSRTQVRELRIKWVCMCEAKRSSFKPRRCSKVLAKPALLLLSNT